jgi:hypothetical protein
MDETHQAAVRAGAMTEEDLLLFAGLTGLRDQYRAMHATEPSDSVRDMLALYGHYLEHGRFFRPQPLPRGYRRGRQNQCYGTAFDLAVRTAGLTYCEGFILVSLGSRATEIEHGWCVAADGRVLELTLRQVGLSYFGIPYRPEQLGGNPDLPLTDDIVLAIIRASADTPPLAGE